MSLAKVNSMGINGIDGYIVTVETDLSNGLPAFDIVGLPDASVKESKERVKAAVKNPYIGNLALQDINGVNKIVIFLSRSEGNVRDAIIAGTEHPKPINIGTKLLPDSPIFLNALSITKATRAI